MDHPQDDTKRLRPRVLAAATRLLASGGRAALTTRALGSLAEVKAPTIYRLFGNMEGLLDAAAEHGWATYIAGKVAREPLTDPVADFREGWDLHVAFALDHPALFAIINDASRPGGLSPAARRGIDVVRRRIRALAAAGLLRVPETRAVGLIRTANLGAVTSLLELPPDQRDPGLATAAREMALAAISTTAPPPETGPVVAAITLRAALDNAGPLSPGERLLLAELLDRITAR